MKQIFYLMILVFELISCHGTTKQIADSAPLSETENKTVSKDPQPIKLTSVNGQFNTGDYYISTEVTYHFSGVGDVNSMDETPYLNESSHPILDSIVFFLNNNASVNIEISYVPGVSHPYFDSCVECSFEETIKRYLVSKGIGENRVVCHYKTKRITDSENNLNVQPRVDSFNKFVLQIN